MSVYHMHSVLTHRCQQRTSDFLRTEVIDSCKLPCGCWELNLDPLKEGSVILTTSPPKTSIVLKIEEKNHTPFDLSVKSLWSIYGKITPRTSRATEVPHWAVPLPGLCKTLWLSSCRSIYIRAIQGISVSIIPLNKRLSRAPSLFKATNCHFMACSFVFVESNFEFYKVIIRWT